MKHFGMTIMAAGLALTAAYYFGAQTIGYAEAGSQSCRYSVETVSGKTTMRSYLNVTLDAASASGESTPDSHSFLRVNVSALDAGCETVTVDRLTIDMAATDNAGTGWVRRAARSGITVEDVETGDVVAVGVPARIIKNEARFFVQEFALRSGETRTLDIYFDASAASAELDDSIHFTVAANGTSWSDEHRSIHEMNAEVSGQTVTF